VVEGKAWLAMTARMLAARVRVPSGRLLLRGEARRWAFEGGTSGASEIEHPRIPYVDSS